jgi:hypothetical protein
MHSECRHIVLNENKRHAAALHGTPYCYFRNRLYGNDRLINTPARLGRGGCRLFFRASQGRILVKQVAARDYIR